MSVHRPEIVTTLPGRSVEELRTEAALAHTSGADLAEIRADRLPPDERERLAELFPPPLPLIATLRSRAEGGEGPDAPELRADGLLAAARLPFRWIDLELRRDAGLVDRLPPASTIGRIFSLHPGPTPPEAWAGFLRELDGVDGIGKLVVPATVSELLGTLVPLLERARGSDLVVHTTGPSGPLLRALARRFEFPLVYAALPEDASGPAVEASQIPVDRLRPYLELDASGPLFAVVGHPVAHSKSPAVHSRWMRAEGRGGLYVALDFGNDDEFVGALSPLGSLGLRGVNVTHPFKRAALGASTEVGPGAGACGAVNCLTLVNGTVAGENTDLAAILRRLSELKTEGRWDGSRLAVLGAGGAARATLAAARELGARATVFARREGAAAGLAREFAATVGGSRPSGPAPLVVQATDVGRPGTGPLELPFEVLVGTKTHVVDWVYDAEDPGVRQATERAGGSYEDGWRLFVYQAAASYAIWWGAEPSAAEFRKALEVGRCEA